MLNTSNYFVLLKYPKFLALTDTKLQSKVEWMNAPPPGNFESA